MRGSIVEAERQRNHLASELLAMEERGWQALSAGSGADFYQGHLTDNAIMVFSFGVLTREEAIATMRSAPPWSTYEIDQPQVTVLTDRSAVLTYHVTAQREGEPSYSAFISTVFVLVDEIWKTAVHQQSPTG